MPWYAAIHMMKSTLNTRYVHLKSRTLVKSKTSGEGKIKVHEIAGSVLASMVTTRARTV